MNGDAQRVLATIPYAVLVQQENKIVYANSEAVLVHGAEAAEQILGRDPLDFVHPSDHARVVTHRREVFDRESLEHKRLHVDGSAFMARSRASDFSWNGDRAALVMIRDTTRRVRDRDALRESEKRYRGLIDGFTFGIQISRSDGERLFVNRKFVEMFGYDSAEEMLAVTEPGALIAPHDRERIVLNRKARAAGLPAPEFYEYDALRKDGTFLPVQVFFRRVFWEGEEAIQRTMIDISARREAEQAQQESEESYRHLAELSPDGIMIVTSGVIVFANDSLAKILGAGSPDELMGLASIDVIPPEHHEEVEARRQMVRSGKNVDTLEGTYLRRDGTRTYVERSAKCITWQGVPSFLVLVRDINGRKKIEAEKEHMVQNLLQAQSQIEEQAEQLKKMAETSNQAMRDAQTANRAKSEFLALMSHELRTPLNAVLGFSEIISQEAFGPLGTDKYSEYASDIYNSGQHLLDLINDILDLSKVESGKDEILDEEIAIDALISQVMPLVTGRAERGGVALRHESPDDRYVLLADRRKLKQILVNLLSNAIKFTAEGGQVFLKAWYQPKSGYMFRVVDNGIGIARDDIPKALSPFQQIESELNRKIEGTGLGLPLSKALVELHGGSLDLQSEVGVGTTVTVCFPPERVIESRTDRKTRVRRSA